MTLARRPLTAALVLAITASLGVAALAPSPALAAKTAAPAGEQLVHKHQMIGKAFKLF